VGCVWGGGGGGCKRRPNERHVTQRQSPETQKTIRATTTGAWCVGGVQICAPFAQNMPVNYPRQRQRHAPLTHERVHKRPGPDERQPRIRHAFARYVHVAIQPGNVAAPRTRVPFNRCRKRLTHGNGPNQNSVRGGVVGVGKTVCGGQGWGWGHPMLRNELNVITSRLLQKLCMPVICSGRCEREELGTANNDEAIQQ